LRIFSLHDLRAALIRYRIAARMTIEGFARLVHVHSRQIARYAEWRLGMTLARLLIGRFSTISVADTGSSRCVPVMWWHDGGRQDAIWLVARKAGKVIRTTTRAAAMSF
jgi:hypothetical protein